MPSLTALALFFLGTIVASFVGVLAVRLNTGLSIVNGRSRCDACDSVLSPVSLVPLISFVVSRGRARCCGVKISPAAPLTEILLGVLFVLAYVKLGLTVVLPFVLLSFAALLALVLYDLAHQILPTRLLVSFVVLGAISGYVSASSLSAFSDALFIAFLTAGSLALIHFFSRGRAMGFSDAPLTFGLGLLTGGAALPGFIFSFWVGALVGIVVLLRRPVGSRMGVEVPFAPYLAAGYILAYFTQWNPFDFAAAFTNF